MNVFKLCRMVQVAGTHDHKKSNNIQESLSMLHGLANLITEHGHPISTTGNQSLTTIAQKFTSGPPTATEALSLLLNENKTNICRHFVSNRDSHADIFHALIVATKQNLNITAIKSEMNTDDGQCVVTFQAENRTQRWKFKQPGQQLADSFLNHLIQWIGTSANGQFVTHKHQEESVTLTFIPSHLYAILATVLTLNPANK